MTWTNTEVALAAFVDPDQARSATLDLGPNRIYLRPQVKRQVSLYIVEVSSDGTS